MSTTSPLHKIADATALLARHAEAQEALELLDKAKRQAEASHAQQRALDAEEQRLTSELGAAEADRALADDREVKALDAQIERITRALDSARREAARNRAVRSTLETAKIPQLTEAARAAGRALNIELSLWFDAAAQSIATQMLQAVGPLKGLMAQVRAINSPQLIRFTCVAMIPDLAGWIDTFGASQISGRNLLADAPDEQQAAAAKVIADALAPIRKALSAAQYLSDYVPIANRPAPPARRGYTMEGIGAPPPAATPRLGDYSRPPGESVRAASGPSAASQPQAEAAPAAKATRGRTVTIDMPAHASSVDIARAEATRARTIDDDLGPSEFR